MAQQTSNESILMDAARALRSRHERIEAPREDGAPVVELDRLEREDGSPSHLRGQLVPADALVRGIRFASRLDEGSAQFLAGDRGTGKTTVLREVAEKLTDGGFCVIPVDAAARYPLTGELTPESVLVGLVAAVGVAAEREVGDPARRALSRFGKRISEALGSPIDMSEPIDLRALRFRLEEGAPLPERVRTNLRDPEGSLARGVQEFFAGIAERLPSASTVLLIDGLEKIQASTDQSASAYRLLSDVFVRFAHVINPPALHVVYVVPPQTLVLAASQLGTVYALPCVRLESRPPTRDRDDAGYAALAALLGARIDLDAIFGGRQSRATRALIHGSGGHLRTLLDLCREVVKEAVTLEPLPQLPLDAAFVQGVLARGHMIRREQARRLRPLLQRVAEGADAGMLSSEGLDQLVVALDQELVGAYANGDLWYDVHPLVRSVLDGPSG